jgi:hypothetical protein
MGRIVFAVLIACTISSAAHAHSAAPALIPENIVWVNNTTITVWGDVFYRRQ